MTITIDEIVANIDTSLAAIEDERARLTVAREQLAASGPDKPPAPKPAARRRARGRNGATKARVLAQLDPREPRTAGEIAKATGIDGKRVATTLSRAVKTKAALKASGRGYLSPPA